MQAIVLDGQLKSALCAVRSLGRQGVVVSVGAERFTAMARYSKHATRRFTYPSPYTKPEVFLRRLKEEAGNMEGKPLVYAFSDATFLLLVRHKSELEACVTQHLPNDRSIEKAFDKSETYALARGLGIPTIDTHLPLSTTDLQFVYETLTYPAIVKTRHSVAWNKGVGIFGSATFVHSEQELTKMFSKLLDTTGEPPLIQQFVKGAEYGVELLARNGEICAEVVHRRIRSLRPTGGASVLKETLSDSPLVLTMKSHTHALVRELSWTGPIMVEFKVDERDGVAKLMEINGRFWGSLPLAIAAGVDFPYLYYKLANGEDIETIRAQEGVVSSHFLGDVRHLLTVLFKKDKMRAYLYPSRVKAVKDFLFPGRGVRGDVFSLHDLKPSIMEYLDVIRKII